MSLHRLVLVTGVGTEIGKTHLATALVAAWGRHEPVFGYKPIESGVAGSVGPDEAALEAASTFHVKHPPLHVRLRAPVSPHLAARLEGRTISLSEVARSVLALRGEAHLVVELAGGLFSPLTDEATNADQALLLAGSGCCTTFELSRRRVAGRGFDWMAWFCRRRPGPTLRRGRTPRRSR
jgi:dethiobiotin synthetase